MFGWLRARRRRRILAEPVPESWARYLDDNVALTRQLSPARRHELLHRMQVFIAEKYWEGCGGLELTEEMQVTIAAQACLLVLGREDELYADVASILIYPSTLITPPRPPGFFEQPRAPIGAAECRARGRAALGRGIARACPHDPRGSAAR